MTDQQPVEQPYGDRPEVETADTEVAHGADGPPADEPDAAEFASWADVAPGEPGPPAVSAFGLDPADVEEAKAAGRILSLTEDPQTGEEEAHAYAEDPSLWLRRRARMIAASDTRPAELAEDSGVEVHQSGEFSGFTEGYMAAIDPANTDSLEFWLRRADGSLVRLRRDWLPGHEDTLAEIRRVALLMEEAVEGGA